MKASIFLTSSQGNTVRIDARLLVLIGMPFPNLTDTTTKLKYDVVSEQTKICIPELLAADSMMIINQSIGITLVDTCFRTGYSQPG